MKLNIFQATWETPAAQILLLLKEDNRTNGDNGITLQDMEDIDEWQKKA